MNRIPEFMVYASEIDEDYRKRTILLGKFLFHQMNGILILDQIIGSERVEICWS